MASRPAPIPHHRLRPTHGENGSESWNVNVRKPLILTHPTDRSIAAPDLSQHSTSLAIPHIVVFACSVQPYARQTHDPTRTHTSSIPHVHARHRADRAVASRAHPHSSHARHADTAHSMAPLLYITPRHTARLTRHSPHNVPSLGHTPSDHRCCCCCCSSSGVTVTSKTTTYVSHLDFSLLLRCVCFEQHDDHSK